MVRLAYDRQSRSAARPLLIDRMVGYGERLCFEGTPLIVAPLAQDAAKRVPEAFEGEAIAQIWLCPG